LETEISEVRLLHKSMLPAIIGVNNDVLEIFMDSADPRRKNLVARPRADNTIEELAVNVTAVKLPVSIDKKVRSLPNRSAWLRRVITEAVQRELIKVVPESSQRDGES
jgi:hypothetical protein